MSIDKVSPSTVQLTGNIMNINERDVIVLPDYCNDCSFHMNIIFCLHITLNKGDVKCIKHPQTQSDEKMHFVIVL